MTNCDINVLQENIKNNSQKLQVLRNELGSRIVGQGALIDNLLIAILANGHILLEGVPGLAKTLAIKTLACAINGSFSRLQFTPDLLPADILGTRIYNAVTGQFSIQKGPIFANLILADEINRAPAKVQSALLEAMQENQITIGGECLKLPDPFFVMATQNPLEQEGTYPLPEAQLDRFMLKCKITYPNRAAELKIIEHASQTLAGLDHHQQPVLSVEDIISLRNIANDVYIDEKIMEYIVDIIISTRPGQLEKLSLRQQEKNKFDKIFSYISCGSSPRGGICLAVAAKCRALLNGRAYVLPEDVKSVAKDVLRHRIVLSFDAEADEITTDDIVEMLLESLSTP